VALESSRWHWHWHPSGSAKCMVTGRVRDGGRFCINLLAWAVVPLLGVDASPQGPPFLISPRAMFLGTLRSSRSRLFSAGYAISFRELTHAVSRAARGRTPTTKRCGVYRKEPLPLSRAPLSTTGGRNMCFRLFYREQPRAATTHVLSLLCGERTLEAGNGSSAPKFSDRPCFDFGEALQEP